MRKLLLALTLLSASAAVAQTANDIYPVEVYDLTYTVPESKNSAGKVIGTVFEAVAGNATNNNHPEYVPTVNAAVVSAFTDVLRLAPVTDQGAYRITGEITSISTTITSEEIEHKDKNGKKYYETVNSYAASVGVSLTLTDLASGQQWTNAFSSAVSQYDYAKNEDEAVKMAIKGLHNKIVAAYDNMFPLTATILERGNEKKDKMQQVYIDLGEANGVYKGLHFHVYEVGMVGGKETRKQIGRLKVEEVLGDDVSLCKVEKGQKEVKAALDAGSTLLVTSYR